VGSCLRFRLVFPLAALCVPGLSLGCPCADNLNGIHNGDTIQTTIVALATGTVPGKGQPAIINPDADEPSCGDLGDLVPGSVLVWSAYLNTPSDGCPVAVILGVDSLSTANVEDGSTLTLPGGCTGQLYLSLGPDESSINFLDNHVNDAGVPSWWLLRAFAPRGEVGLCPAAVQKGCSDIFVAQNVLLPH
jgi:hypothetical protein